jgi:hypothetical protein
VAGAVERGAYEYLALEIGKRRHHGERCPRPPALLDELFELLATGDVWNLVRHRDHSAEMVERHVARYHVQPRPDVDHLGTG